LRLGGFYRWEWSRASFTVAGEPWTAEIDALAVRTGAGTATTQGAGAADRFVRLDRTGIRLPPAVNERIGTTYSSICGTLVRIEVERATGTVRVVKAYSVVECGPALVPEVVVGQAQGGFATAWATPCWKGCRSMRADPATGHGISAGT
jgi:CO/xanthine dehydrogenase Mo-binding subunit